MFRTLRILAASFALLLPLSLSAALIPLAPLELPLLAFGPGALSYDPAPASRVLHIEAPASLFILPPVAVVVGGELVADLTLDNGTCAMEAGSGTFELTGTTQIGPDVFGSPLLVGEIMEFGFEDTSPVVDKYELRVQLTGGSLYFLYATGEIGVEIVSEGSNFEGICSVAFSGNAKGQLGGLATEVCDVVVDKLACVVPDPDIPGDACEGGVVSIGFTYTGDGCGASDNGQDPAKSVCTGGAPGDPVDIIATGKARKSSKKTKASKKTKSSKKRKASMKGDVPVFGAFLDVVIGDMFLVDAAASGLDKLGTELNLSVVDPVTGDVLQTVQMHTSCSQPIVPDDQFGSLNVKGFTSARGGAVGGPAVPPDPTCVTEIPAPVPACTQKGDKLFAIDLLYEGGDCFQTSHSQDPNKVGCAGDAGVSEPVDIKVSADGEVYLDASGVILGETLSALASNAGVDKMKAESRFEISQGGDVLQAGFFHTSCSQPLDLADQFGALEVVGVGNLLGTGNPGGGVDVEYTITVGNPNAEELRVDVIDPMLGINLMDLPIPAGGEIEIAEIATIDGPTTNTVTVLATLDGQFCADAEASAEISQEMPPPLGAVCTRSIQGTTLEYIGPHIPGPVTVEFEAKEFESDIVVYDLGGDLHPGDVLTMPAENGMTIDALAHGADKLGSRTRIRIITNGGTSVVQETIHTSCSALYVLNQPAPLDGESGEKGDPSDNWFVLDFSQKP